MRHPCIRIRLSIALLLAAGAGMAGCGAPLSSLAQVDAAFAVARTGTDDTSVAEPFIVVLDWDAGENGLYPAMKLRPVDLHRFGTDDGRTLADRAAEFKRRVRERMQAILNDIEGVTITVVEQPLTESRVETTVHLTQEVSPEGNREIGRAHYDPCNQFLGDEAAVFGEQILQLGDGCSFDDWVNVFANVSAHETAHTLGFGHVSRAEHPPTARALNVELMLDGHTISEIRGPQRLAHDLSSCPVDLGDVPETVSAKTPH